MGSLRALSRASLATSAPTCCPPPSRPRTLTRVFSPASSHPQQDFHPTHLKSLSASSQPQRTWRRAQPESQLAISQLLRSFRLTPLPFRPRCFQQAYFPLSSPRLLNCPLSSRPLPSTHLIFARALASSLRLKPLA